MDQVFVNNRSSTRIILHNTSESTDEVNEEENRTRKRTITPVKTKPVQKNRDLENEEDDENVKLEVTVKELRNKLKSLEEVVSQKNNLIGRTTREKERLIGEIRRLEKSQKHLKKQLHDERTHYQDQHERFCLEVKGLQVRKQKGLSEVSKSSERRPYKRTSTGALDEKTARKLENEKLRKIISDKDIVNHKLCLMYLRMQQYKNGVRQKLQELEREYLQVLSNMMEKMDEARQEFNFIISQEFKKPIDSTNAMFLQMLKKNSRMTYENSCLKLQLQDARTELNKYVHDNQESRFKNLPAIDRALSQNILSSKSESSTSTQTESGFLTTDVSEEAVKNTGRMCGFEGSDPNSQPDGVTSRENSGDEVQKISKNDLAGLLVQNRILTDSEVHLQQALLESSNFIPEAKEIPKAEVVTSSESIRYVRRRGRDKVDRKESCSQVTMLEDENHVRLSDQESGHFSLTNEANSSVDFNLMLDQDDWSEFQSSISCKESKSNDVAMTTNDTLSYESSCVFRTQSAPGVIQSKSYHGEDFCYVQDDATNT